VSANELKTEGFLRGLIGHVLRLALTEEDRMSRTTLYLLAAVAVAGLLALSACTPSGVTRTPDLLAAAADVRRVSDALVELERCRAEIAVLARGGAHPAPDWTPAPPPSEDRGRD